MKLYGQFAQLQCSKQFPILRACKAAQNIWRFAMLEVGSIDLVLGAFRIMLEASYSWFPAYSCYVPTLSGCKIRNVFDDRSSRPRLQWLHLLRYTSSYIWASFVTFRSLILLINAFVAALCPEHMQNIYSKIGNARYNQQRAFHTPLAATLLAVPWSRSVPSFVFDLSLLSTLIWQSGAAEHVPLRLVDIILPPSSGLSGLVWRNAEWMIRCAAVLGYGMQQYIGECDWKTPLRCLAPTRCFRAAKYAILATRQIRCSFSTMSWSGLWIFRFDSVFSAPRNISHKTELLLRYGAERERYAART